MAAPTSSADAPAYTAPASHEEYGYLNLVRAAIEQGQHRADRTGTGTLSLFAPPPLRFSLSRPSTDPADPSPELVMPLLTTKKVFTRGIFEELLWFVAGSTSAKLLSEKGVRIWDGNGSKEFLESRGLGHREEGDLGPVYGFQWRHFGAEYKDAWADYNGQGVDQLATIINAIKNNPMDRRMLMVAWNPKDLPLMALPPCHYSCQFYVSLPPANSPPNTKPTLSCLMNQRSADLGLGIPFNIASYALLVHMIAHVTDTVPGELTMMLGDAHVYMDHVEALKTQLEREPKGAFPRFRIKRTKEEVGGIDGFEMSDFVVEGYVSHPAVPMKMSV